jgi:hypothetical protein
MVGRPPLTWAFHDRQTLAPGEVRRVLVNHVGVQKTRPGGYADRSVMDTIRILHHHEPGFGWSFESPYIPGLTGGGDIYDQTHAEDAARFALVCAAEEQGTPAPANLLFEHYVPVGVPATA